MRDAGPHRWWSPRHFLGSRGTLITTHTTSRAPNKDPISTCCLCETVRNTRNITQRTRNNITQRTPLPVVSGKSPWPARSPVHQRYTPCARFGRYSTTRAVPVVRTENGSRVVKYLLSIVSSVCILPPEGLLLPQLDDRLVEAIGVLRCSEPSMLDRFPEVGGAALGALLQSKPLDNLCRMSKLGVDMMLCDNRADLIQGMNAR